MIHYLNLRIVGESISEIQDTLTSIAEDSLYDNVGGFGFDYYMGSYSELPRCDVLYLPQFKAGKEDDRLEIKDNKLKLKKETRKEE